jgi:hypothetical protein
MNALLFVESPMQILNAFEAVSYFNINNYTIFVRLSKNKINDNQIKKLLKILEIDNKFIKFIIIKSKNKNIIDYFKLLFYRFYFLFIKKNIDKVFIGNYKSKFFKLIIHQFDNQKLILLDDGNKTLSIQNEFTNTNNYNLFTMYSNIKPLNNQKIFINSYKNISKKINTLNIIYDKILFLGSPLCEIGIIRFDYYLNLIDKICNYYNNKVIYIVHRRESKNKLKYIENNKNIIIKELDYPVELYGLYENEIPYKVSSFYSTAILTMKNIYKLEAECFKFNYSDSDYVKSIDEIYSFYQNEIKVIEIYD